MKSCKFRSLETNDINITSNQNRKSLFKSLKRKDFLSNQDDDHMMIKTKKQRPRSKSQIKCRSQTQDLFRRSINSLSQRTHRRDLKPVEEPLDDIPYYHNKAAIKDYKPPSEMVQENVDKKKKIYNDALEEKEEKMKKECTFIPNKVSRQTKVEYHDLNENRRNWDPPEVPKVKPVINKKSKAIAENLANDTTIFTRQISKIFHSKGNSENKDENNQTTSKITKDDLNNMINRLTKSEPRNEYTDEESINDENHPSKISYKTLNRLVESSLKGNEKYITNSNCEEKNVDYYNNPYRPEINKNSREIANRISRGPRDLYQESIKEANKKEQARLEHLRFQEIQDLAECKVLPKRRKRPSCLSHIHKISFKDLREEKEFNNHEHIDSFYSESIEFIPFSFDPISKKRLNR